MAILLNRMKSLFYAVMFWGLAVTAAYAQKYEFSVLGGYTNLDPGPLGSHPDNETRKDTDTSLKADRSYGARFTINTKGYYGHELGYRLTRATLRTTLRGQLNNTIVENTLQTRVNVHSASYNFLMYMMPAGEWWRPYITVGGQMFRYDKPNFENWRGGAYTSGGANLGCGLKLKARNFLFRVDFRDYIEGKPYALESQEPFETIGGIFHQLEATVGVGITF